MVEPVLGSSFLLGQDIEARERTRAAEAAAERMWRSVRKRQEGKITQFLDSLGESVYNTLARPSRIWGELQSVPPGQPLSERPDIIDAVAQTALDLVGMPAITGSVPAGALGSGAGRWYSAVEKAVERAGDKMPAEQWIGTIRNTPGVKSEELQWTGVEDWLKQQKGSVTKQQVQDFVRANQIELREVMKSSENPYPYRTADEWQNAIFRAERQQDWDEAQRLTAAWEGQEGLGSAGTAKFEQWQMAGDKQNYRELLLMLPPKEADRAVIAGELRQKYGDNFVDYWTPQERARYEASGAGAPRFTGGHYDEPNVLAHVRFNDRTIDGKRTLFIEEIQSDWHQKGRKQGYKTSERPEGWTVENVGGNLWEVRNPNGTKIDTATSEDFAWRVARAASQGRGPQMALNEVPDAPFKTTWPELAFKRMIRYASEQGYDRIAWTPGRVQAERYDLSKHVNRIYLEEPVFDENGKFLRGNLSAYTHTGGKAINKKVTADELSDAIGKDAADRLINNPTRKTERQHVLTGDDLRVGGEGMVGFYDKMLPAMANKLTKKYGAKVESVPLTTGQSLRPVTDGRGNWYLFDEITQDHWVDPQIGRIPSFSTEAEARGAIRGRAGGQPVHTLDITPQLRKAAIEQGFPLFTGGASPIAVPNYLSQMRGDIGQTSEGHGNAPSREDINNILRKYVLPMFLGGVMPPKPEMGVMPVNPGNSFLLGLDINKYRSSQADRIEMAEPGFGGSFLLGQDIEARERTRAAEAAAERMWRSVIKRPKETIVQFDNGVTGGDNIYTPNPVEKAFLGVLNILENTGFGGKALKIYNDVIQRGRAEAITEKDFTSEELSRLKNLVLKSRGKSNRTKGAVQRKDYVGAGEPLVDGFQNILGNFRYIIEEDGSILIEDKYDFNNVKELSIESNPIVQSILGPLNPVGFASHIGRRIKGESSSGVPVKIRISEQNPINPGNSFLLGLDINKRETAAQQATDNLIKTTNQKKLYEEAITKYPILKKYDFDFKYSPGRSGGFLETWPPGEEGSPKLLRPKDFPIDRYGIEVYSEKTRPLDILGDVTSHLLIEVDPTVKQIYNTFRKSITSRQEAILKEQYQYARKHFNEKGTYSDWKERSGIPGFFRAYPFKQWSPEEIQRSYDPRQIKLLDKLKQYLQIE